MMINENYLYYNFALGLALGIVALIVWINSVLAYWLIFSPIAIGLFILMNRKVLNDGTKR